MGIFYAAAPGGQVALRERDLHFCRGGDKLFSEAGIANVVREVKR